MEPTSPALKTRAQAVVMYTGTGDPAAAYSNPPINGPVMVAVLKTPLPQADATGKISAGTSSGIKACPAGPLNTRIRPIPTSTQ